VCGSIGAVLDVKTFHEFEYEPGWSIS
jgi:hypothetical protein